MFISLNGSKDYCDYIQLFDYVHLTSRLFLWPICNQKYYFFLMFSPLQYKDAFVFVTYITT